MRIAATVIVIAIVTAGAGCGSRSSAFSPSQTVASDSATQTTPAPTTTNATRTATVAASATTTSTSKSGAKTMPAHLIGQRLDVTERILRDAGISYKLIRLHDHAGGAPSGWGVCETNPAPGKRLSSAHVDLIVVHSKCGAP